MFRQTQPREVAVVHVGGLDVVEQEAHSRSVMMLHVIAGRHLEDHDAVLDVHIARCGRAALVPQAVHQWLLRRGGEVLSIAGRYHGSPRLGIGGDRLHAFRVLSVDVRVPSACVRQRAMEERFERAAARVGRVLWGRGASAVRCSYGSQTGWEAREDEGIHCHRPRIVRCSAYRQPSASAGLRLAQGWLDRFLPSETVGDSATSPGAS